MTVLMPQMPLDGLVKRHGALCLKAVELGRISWIAPFPGEQAEVSHALQAAFSLRFPAPGECQESMAGRIQWSGRAQALLIGPRPPSPIERHAAVIDQSEGWAVMTLTGRDVAQALARLTPIDLRPNQFVRGRTARSLLGSMNAQFTAIECGVEIMVMRSMAQTAAHEVEVAMRSVAARNP